MTVRISRVSSLLRLAGSLPLLLKAGFTLLAAGLIIDVAYHLLPRADHTHELGLGAQLIHLLVFAGMALSLAGIAWSAVRRPVLRAADPEGRREP
jgi:hypothetical protein